MIPNINQHPCFNPHARSLYARVHLPVAPKCNIQCTYCDRKYSCPNENRPGVTSTVLSPGQALAYLEALQEQIPNIAVAGIAGPGDAFADAPATLETLRLVREKYPSMLFCIATNGWGIEPYIDELQKYNVTHLTITVNAVDAQIGASIYAWVREKGKIYRGKAAAEILIARQLNAIARLSRAGITVKINSVLIPGVNDSHMAKVAEAAASWGAHLFNCIPLYPVPGTPFERVSLPSAEELGAIRRECARYLPQMEHCTRCRADAAGKLNEPMAKEIVQCLETAASLPLNPYEDRPYIAVASATGTSIDQHLGEARLLRIYENKENEFNLLAVRETPAPGCGDERWEKLAAVMEDCRAVLVSGVGRRPAEVLKQRGVRVYELEAAVEQGLKAVFAAAAEDTMKDYEPKGCVNRNCTKIDPSSAGCNCCQKQVNRRTDEPVLGCHAEALPEAR